jgi:hypothetical protein
MKKINIEVSNHEANILQALLKMKGGTADRARTILVDGIYNNLMNVKCNQRDYDELEKVLDNIKNNNLDFPI